MNPNDATPSESPTEKIPPSVPPQAEPELAKTRQTARPEGVEPPSAPPMTAPLSTSQRATEAQAGAEAEKSTASLPGRYRLIRLLGQGGFATVHLAYDSVLDQQVAIKSLKLGLASKSDRDRFLMEARIGAKLRHPNIVTVFDIVQTSDGLQMVMEFYPGGTLSERLRAKGAMHPREAISAIRQIAQALAYAHRHNVIHRDVKPANIFLAGDGMVKLGDFGIASHSDHHEFTQTGMIIGTPLYMAPEQSADSRDVDPRTDIYALGLTLYHALAGRPPRIIDLDAIPEAFRRLVKQATAHERQERLVSCEQFIAMLDQIAAAVQFGRGAAGMGAGAGDFASTSSSLTPWTPQSSPQTPAPPTTDEVELGTPSETGPALAGQEQTTATLTPAQPTPQPGARATTAPAQPRRKGPWLWIVSVLGAALATAGICYYFMQPPDRPGEKNQHVVPNGTPAPAAQARKRPEPPRITEMARRRGKEALPPAGFAPGERPRAKAPLVAEGVRRRMEARREAQIERAIATPSPTPSPTVQPKRNDLENIEEAYFAYLAAHPGVANALEILRERGGEGAPPSMRNFAMKQAQSTIQSALEKTPNDPIMNLIVGNMHLRAGNPQLALQYLNKAVALDQQAGAPLNLTQENIQQAIKRTGMRGRR